MIPNADVDRFTHRNFDNISMRETKYSIMNGNVEMNFGSLSISHLEEITCCIAINWSSVVM